MYMYVNDVSCFVETKVVDMIRSISEISSCFLGRDPGTLKSDIVSKKHPQLFCSDLRLSN